MNGLTWKHIFAAFLAGVILSCAIGLWIIHDSSAKLEAALTAAGWSVESATRKNAELTDSLRRISIELEKSNSLALGQQRRINEQQRIIDGIVGTITNAGEDIRSQIEGIADIARRLYAVYHPGEK